MERAIPEGDQPTGEALAVYGKSVLHKSIYCSQRGSPEGDQATGEALAVDGKSVLSIFETID